MSYFLGLCCLLVAEVAGFKRASATQKKKLTGTTWFLSNLLPNENHALLQSKKFLILVLPPLTIPNSNGLP